MIEYAGTVMAGAGMSNTLEPFPQELQSSSRWEAIQRRDASCDGSFLYGVVTTGIFCRPSCASRQPLLTNVRFFDTAAEAQAAGFRACKRCHPLKSGKIEDVAARSIRDACRWLANNLDAPLHVSALAARAGWSEGHFHRAFKRLTGVTPMQYADHLRTGGFKADLKNASNVTESAYANGFGSSRGVYERAGTELGMTPAQYRKGGKGVSISYLAVATPLGHMMLAATDRGLCFLQFSDTEAGLLLMLKKEYPLATLEPVRSVGPALELWLRPVLAYLSSEGPCPDLPVDIRATAFQLRVWKYLQTIPHGQTRSYAEVAKAIGKPTAHRAVARACASNSVALLVPCHRVLRGDGGLSGYRWGVERKRALLNIEESGSKPR